MLLVAAAVGVCAIVTGVSLAVFSSPSNGQAGHVAGAGNSPLAATSQAAQPTPPVASSTTGPNVTTNGIAKTAMQYPPVLKDTIARWKAGRGGAAWSAVTAQLANATQTAGLGLYSALRAQCAILGSSVATAKGAPPIPDKAMQVLYAKALTGISSATADCRNAISIRPVGDEGQQFSVNKNLLNRSLAEFVAESKNLYAATAEIRTLHG